VTFDEAHRAIKRGNLISIRNALGGGMNVNLSNRFSWTLLMLAGIEGNTKIGELLIERGANLDERSAGGETALSVAASQGHARFVELLLHKGASLECQPHGHSLGCWMTKTSGFPAEKIEKIIQIIESHRQERLAGCAFCSRL
jgi:ankyrin repeat protein